MSLDQNGDGLDAALSAIVRLDAEVAQLKADKLFMHELAARANERIRQLMASNAELVAALQLMVEQFTKTPSTLKDSQARVKAHAALAKATKEQA
jgi:hypothetical protein